MCEDFFQHTTCNPLPLPFTTSNHPQHFFTTTTILQRRLFDALPCASAMMPYLRYTSCVSGVTCRRLLYSMTSATHPKRWVANFAALLGAGS